MEPADGRLARRRVSAWKGVRGNFQDFLGDQIKCRGTLASLEGPGKEQIKEAAQERLLENVISSINKDTPEGRHMYQRWTRAQASHHQVCDALRSKNFRRDLSDYAGGTKATRDAVKVFFPEDWCRLLSEDEILAELVVDCATSSIVDSLLDASIELLESHEGWYWPTQHPFRRLQSTPELRVWGSSSPVASWVNQSVTQSPKSFREQVSQPELPPRWRQPVDRSRGSRDLSLSSLSRDLDAPAKGKTLKHFRSAKPFNPFMTRLYSFTDSQRPQRRLQREPRDPFAPKWSFPMMAHHFPEQWNRMVPPSTPKCVTTPVASTRDDADREEEVPPGYTWLQRKVVSDDACDSVSMLQTGYSIEDGLSLESSQGLDAEVASLSNRLVDLTQKFASMENDTARYHETMKLLAHEESHAARQALVAEELDLLLRVSNSNSTTGISGFDTWCLAHSDLVLGVLTFLATSVLIALCIPCGLAPVQIIAWFLSEDKPQVPTVIKETT